jgi:hypothetical protein
MSLQSGENIRYTVDTLKCPSCGGDISETDKKCSFCHSTLIITRHVVSNQANSIPSGSEDSRKLIDNLTTLQVREATLQELIAARNKSTFQAIFVSGWTSVALCFTTAATSFVLPAFAPLLRGEVQPGSVILLPICAIPAFMSLMGGSMAVYAGKESGRLRKEIKERKSRDKSVE